MKQKIINSLANPYIKSLIKLKEKKYRDEARLYLIEGFHLLEMAKEYLVQVLIVNNVQLPQGLDHIECVIVSNEVISKLSQTITPQPIIGVCRYKDDPLLLGKKIVLLDHLQDPGNVGTLIRSALAFDFNAIIVGEDTVDIYNDKVIRASQGAIFKINIVRKNIISFVEELKKEMITIIGTSIANGQKLSDVSKIDKYALILGNEGCGVKEELLKKTDFNVYIPMNEKIDSLNVGVAGSIIMYHFSF